MPDVTVLETIGNAITVINQGTVGPQGPVGAQGVPGIDGASGLFVVRVTESTTAQPNSYLLADTSGTDSGATYTFPSSPQTGWRVRVLDVGGTVATKPITVAGNGHDINGCGETRTIFVPYAGESFVFDGVSDSWRLEEKVLLDGKEAIEAHVARVDNPHAVTKAQIGLSNVTDDAQVKRSEMGVANGVSTLGNDGVIPLAQLPPISSGPWSDPIPATYASTISFTVASDVTSQFAAGVRVQADCGTDGDQYGTVSGVSGTTVTLSMDSGAALTANLTAVLHGNDVPASLCNHAAQHATGSRDPIITVIASLPAHYSRSSLATVASTTDATGRHTYVPPGRITCNINDGGYYLAGAAAMDLNTAANWDTTTGLDGTVPDNRAGQNVYTYLCDDADGSSKLLYSFNSTYPAGYTSSNSRKCGGFHCLCVAAGVISGHPASGYLAGDIVPPSIWDLQWRPRCAPEGMRYVAGVWQDIYMPSVIGGALRPVYGGTMADGASMPVFDWYDFTEWLAREGKRLATQAEFMAGALGSNEGTNIVGSVDPGTAGGHTDTAGRRMISATFGEDYCGVMWQWGIEPGAVPGTAAWKDQFVASRTSQRGQGYDEPTHAILGGEWANGAYCGSRGSAWNNGPLVLGANVGARGVAEPLAVGV